MLDKKSLLQSIQQRSRTTNSAGEYIPYLQNEGILDYISDTAKAIGTSIVGETDAEKKKREDQQASDIAKQRDALKAKGAPTTQEAPTPPTEPITTTSTSVVADPRDRLTGDTENDRAAIARQQKKLEAARDRGELSGAQVSQGVEQLANRSGDMAIETGRKEGEKAVERGIDTGLTIASLTPGVGKYVAAAQSASQLARGALYGGKKMNDQGEMVADDVARGYYTDAAGSAVAAVLPGAISGLGKVAAAVAPKTTAAGGDLESAFSSFGSSSSSSSESDRKKKKRRHRK
jgi:hypothetical protein